MASKLQALKNLRDWGFNVPHFLEFNGETTFNDVEDFASGERLGLRTSMPLGGESLAFSLPFLYDLTPSQAYLEAVRYAQTYDVILQRVVPPELSRYSCNAIMDERGSGFVEYLPGTHLCRDVEKAHWADLKRHDFTYVSQVPHEIIRDALESLKDIPLLVGHKVVIEFTVLHEPAGVKEERVVVWEYRDAA